MRGDSKSLGESLGPVPFVKIDLLWKSDLYIVAFEGIDVSSVPHDIWEPIALCLLNTKSNQVRLSASAYEQTVSFCLLTLVALSIPHSAYRIVERRIADNSGGTGKYSKVATR